MLKDKFINIPIKKQIGKSALNLFHESLAGSKMILQTRITSSFI